MRRSPHHIPSLRLSGLRKEDTRASRQNIQPLKCSIIFITYVVHTHVFYTHFKPQKRSNLLKWKEPQKLPVWEGTKAKNITVAFYLKKSQVRTSNIRIFLRFVFRFQRKHHENNELGWSVFYVFRRPPPM